jgi:16S rRNA U516 pseudouridylate synthase RsuA-like enzyme
VEGARAGYAVAAPALAAARVAGVAGDCVDLTIVEGRYRQVRRMWEELGGNRVVQPLPPLLATAAPEPLSMG